MSTAKIIPHGEGRAVVLPRDFPASGDEVEIERRGEEWVFKPLGSPRPKFRTLNEVARYFAEKYPDAPEFPDPPPRPQEHERPILEW